MNFFSFKRLIESIANAENVVNPPQNPTIKNKLSSTFISLLRLKYLNKIPANKHPIIFTANVPIGNES